MLSSRRNRSRILRTLEGRTKEGAEEAREVLQARLRLYPDTAHTDVATSWIDVARDSSRDGDSVEAEKAFRRALDMRTQLYGEGSPHVARTHNDLARVLFRLDRLQEAREHQEAAWASYREKEPLPSLGAVVAKNLAAVLERTGECGEALALLDRVDHLLSTLTIASGEVHHADALSIRGSCLRQTGRSEAGNQLICEALDRLGADRDGAEVAEAEDARRRLPPDLDPETDCAESTPSDDDPGGPADEGAAVQALKG